MIGIIAGTLAGVALGTISGLFPGVHSNTLAASLLGLQAFLLPVVGIEALVATMVSALVTHTFLDSIPSTFLGVPDADTSLSVLPSHRMCLEGKGQEAVRVAALGSACAVIIAVPLSLLLFCVLPPIQPFIDWWAGIILVAVMGYLIIRSDAPGWALVTFGVSGLLGLFAFRYAFLGWHTLGDSGVLMPLLTGLFGISFLLVSARGRIPAQRFQGISLSGDAIRRGTLLGTVAGTIVGWLPGLSNAAANAVLYPTRDYTRDKREYIFSVAAANTANAIIGIAVLYAIGRERNGVMVAVSALGPPDMVALMFAGVLAAGIAYPLTIWLSGYADRLDGVDSRVMNYSAMAFVIALSFILCGPFGLLILGLAILVGIIPGLVNVSRVFCMGAVTFPVILFSLGLPGF